MEKQIPKFQETFLPILKVLSKNGSIKTNELKKRVRDEFYGDLPKELLEETTKNGDILILNRIAWAKAYLKQGGMIEQPERALVRITDKGRKILEKGSLTLKELLHDEEFLARELKGRKTKEKEDVNENASPQDLIDAGFKAVESSAKNDLLARLKDIDPFYFQKVILLLLEKMGYGDFTETPKSGDGGVDGVISQDKLGLEKIYIQAKRYTDNKVREGEIRNFIGAMSRDANKGIFVTTSTFDEKAIQKARDAGQKIIPIDGPMLVDLMYKYGVGMQVRSTYEIKQVDEDFLKRNNNYIFIMKYKPSWRRLAVVG